MVTKSKNKQEYYFSEKNLLHKHIEGALVSRMLAWSRIVLGIQCSLLFFVPILLLRLFSKRATAVLLRKFFQCLCWIIGLKIVLHGRAEALSKAKEEKPRRIYVTNHVSYLDILALRACFNVRFVTKKEIKSWPYIGWYAMLCDSIFVAQSASGLKEQFRQISIALRKKKSLDLVLFPEDATPSGWDVLQFRRELFDVLPKEVQEGTSIVVQPVSVWYSKVDNVTMTVFERDFVGWVGNETLYPHIIRCLGLGCITLEIFVHEEITVQKPDDLNLLSAMSREKIMEGVDTLKEIKKK